ncbi:sterol desaturase family protein [Peristeroidobacter soli]|uniref:sterol desaturase family protein n=1 Tax=Peristeroidobacter soli TaxID=2497877 RepID=UPI001C378FAD|nr:sterol desaturase family protein [Peristeroidobacter soli]
METLATLRSLVVDDPIGRFLAMFLIVVFMATLFQGYLRARKIQPNGFKWRTLRNEFFFAVLNVSVTAFILTTLTAFLTRQGFISFKTGPVQWWVVALEYAFYFFAFDTYFYWLHRWMHNEPVYTWVHKIHHESTSPNLLTTLSVGPLESVINGGFVPLFTATFHDQHHKYFKWNFGGYTTIWDFLCGTVRPKYLSDFDQIKARASGAGTAAPANASSD